jgi:hypothetical protein
VISTIAKPHKLNADLGQVLTWKILDISDGKRMILGFPPRMDSQPDGSQMVPALSTSHVTRELLL